MNQTIMANDSIPAKRSWAVWVANIGLLILLAAIALPLLRIGGDAWRWIYAAGAAVLLVGRIAEPKKMPTLRAGRLKRLETWAAIVFCAGVFFAFYKGAQPRDWLAFFLAGGVIQVYVSMAMPSALKKKD